MQNSRKLSNPFSTFPLARSDRLKDKYARKKTVKHYILFRFLEYLMFCRISTHFCHRGLSTGHSWTRNAQMHTERHRFPVTVRRPFGSLARERDAVSGCWFAGRLVRVPSKICGYLYHPIQAGFEYVARHSSWR